MEEKEIKSIKIWKLLFLLSLIFFGISLFFYITQKPNNIRKQIINNNYQNQKINGIEIKKIKIYKKNNKYYFTAKAINKTKKDIKLKNIEIKLDNYTFNSYIGENLKSKEYKMIFMETDKDISNIKKIQFIF
ncbi:MAG: hypothetical protein IKF91_00115 [Bacilli bacterium]|nr:hypothetical protein [Bacilli bacterium]